MQRKTSSDSDSVPISELISLLVITVLAAVGQLVISQMTLLDTCMTTPSDAACTLSSTTTSVPYKVMSLIQNSKNQCKHFPGDQPGQVHGIN